MSDLLTHPWAKQEEERYKPILTDAGHSPILRPREPADPSRHWENFTEITREASPDLAKPRKRSFDEQFSEDPFFRDLGTVLGKRMAESDDPVFTATKAKVSLQLASLLNLDPEYVYDNFDAVGSSWTGKTRAPDGWYEAVADTFKIAWKENKINKLYFRMMTDGDSEELRSEIEEEKKDMPGPDIYGRWFPVQWLKDASLFVGQKLENTAPALAAGGGTAAAGMAGVAALSFAFPGLGTLGAVALKTVGIKTFGAGFSAAYATQAGMAEAGASYRDMIEEGVDPGIARPIAFAVGGLNMGLEYLQLKTILKAFPGADKLFTTALRASVFENIVTGRIRSYAAKAALRFAGKTVGTGLTEALQEAAQEVVGLIGDTAAKNLNNRIKGTELDTVSFREAAAQVWEVAKSTFRGATVLGIPGGVASGWSALSEGRKNEGEKKTAPLPEEGREKTPPSGEQAGPGRDRRREVQAELDGALAEMREKKTEQTVLRAAALTRRLEELEREEAPVPGEKPAAGGKQEEPEAASETASPAEIPVWRMSREERIRRRMDLEDSPLPVPENLAHALKSEPLRELIKKHIPAMSESQVDGSILILDLHAAVNGKNFATLVGEYFAPGVFASPEESSAMLADPRKKAAVKFLEDGKALMAFSERADFSSWLEEVTHVLRRHLEPESLRIAEEVYGITDGAWSVGHEERFAQDLRDYLLDGSSPSPQLEGIFKRFAEWLRRIYSTLKKKSALDPRLREVFDGLFYRPESPLSQGVPAYTSPDQANSVESVLFQTDEVSSREMEEVRRRYDGKEGFLKAPNGKRTLLTEQQWLYVRTPGFKERAGDWEAIERAKELESSKAITIESGELKRLSGKPLRKAAEKIYRDIASRGSVVTSDGKSVTLTMRGFREIKSHSADERVLKIVPDIHNLLKNSLYLWREDDRKNRPNIRGFFNYGVKISLEGKTHYARLVIREDSSGYFHYDHDIDEIEVGKKENQGTAPHLIPNQGVDYPGHKNSVTPWIDSVKNLPIAKYLDENGEPRFREGLPEFDVEQGKGYTGEEDIAYGSAEEANRIFEEVSSGFRQLEFNFSSKNDSVQISRGQAGRYSDFRYRRIPGTWKKHRRISFVGEKVDSLRGLAEMFSVFRHPRLEHFHIVYTNDSGEILGHNSISSGLPSRAFASETGSPVKNIFRIRDRMRRLQATGYYLLHNHPSGRVESSPEDIAVTQNYQRNIPGLKGHIIIDHEAYTFIDGRTLFEEEFSYSPKGRDDFRKDVGEALTATDAVFKVAKEIIQGETKTAVIVADNAYRVVSWDPIRAESYSEELIHQKVREAGGSRAFLVTSAPEVYEIAKKMKVSNKTGKFDWLIDVALLDGDSFTSAVSRFEFAPKSRHEDYVVKKLREGKDWGYVWEPENVTYLPETLFQDDPDYEEIRSAVERGEWVPDTVLNEFISEEWAREELDFRKSLYDDVRLSENEEEFVSFQMAMSPVEKPATYWARVFAEAKFADVSREEGNRRFLASLSREMLEAIFDQIAGHGEIDSLPEGIVRAGAQHVAKGLKLSEKHFKKIIDQIRYDAAWYREHFAKILGDEDEIILLQREAEKNPDGTELERLKKELREEKRSKERLKKTFENIQHELDLTNRTLREFERETARLGETLESARAESELLEKGLKKEARIALKDARSEANALKVFAKKQERDRLRELSREKAYVLRLIKDITRKPGPTIDAEYVDKILAVQSRYEVKTSRAGAAYRQGLSELRDSINDAAMRIFIDKQLSVRNLKKMTIEELEAVHEEIQSLFFLGREVLLIKKIQKRTQRNAWREAAEEAVRTSGKTAPILPAGSREQRERRERGSHVRDVELKFMHPLHVMERLDGKENGIIKNLLWDMAQGKYNEKMRSMDKRTDHVVNLMKELGLTVSPLALRRDTYLYRQISSGGVSFTASDVMFMYLGVRNGRTDLALEFGNFRGAGNAREVMNGLIRQLSPEEKTLAEAIAMDFEENFSRLDRAAREVENKRVMQEQNYLPMARTEFSYESIQEAALDEFVRAGGYGVQTARSGFLESRVDIGKKHQTPIRLDLIGTYLSAVEQQEHYIAYQGLVKDLNSVFLGREARGLRDVVERTFGAEYNDTLRSWIISLANGEYRGASAAGHTWHKLRGDLGIAYLAYSIPSTLKQLVSILPYLGYAGPHRIAAAAAEFIASPRRFLREIEELSPAFKHRSANMMIQAAKSQMTGSEYKKIIRQLGRNGLKGIEWVDKVSVALGWKAVYDKHFYETKDSAAAARWADEVTSRTQPSGRGLDMAEIYREGGEGWKMLLQFTQPLNVIWNNFIYDIPKAALRGRLSIVVGLATAYAVSGIAVKMIEDPPEDDEEKKGLRLALDAGSQFLDSIPIVGSEATAAARSIFGLKTFRRRGEVILPALSRSIDAAESFGKGDLENAILYMTEALGYAKGLPVSQPRRLYRAIREGYIGEIIGWRRRE